MTVEICNYFQAYFIEKDVALYDEVSNMPALARTSNMNSDLGMVEYVFSDKTGTLTDNVMRFRRCSIGGVVYGSAPLVSIDALAAPGLQVCNPNHNPSHNPSHNHNHNHNHNHDHDHDHNHNHNHNPTFTLKPKPNHNHSHSPTLPLSLT